MSWRLTFEDLDNLERLKMSKAEYEVIQTIIARRGIGLQKMKKELRTVAFTKEKIYSLPAEPLAGIYAIFDLDKCIYIGESTDIRDRLLHHYSHMINSYPDPLYTYMRECKHLRWGILRFCHSRDERASRELEYIEKYQPLFNECGTSLPYIRPSK